MSKMRYCECPFPIYKDQLDVHGRLRKKCQRCLCYEDPVEAAENGRPLSRPTESRPTDLEDYYGGYPKVDYP